MICSNPAITSGLRTTNRAKKASLLLGFDTFAIGNLLDIPTYRTGDISEIAVDRVSWINSRANLSRLLAEASGVLLAYGVGKPAGPARAHFLDQVSWLSNQIKHRKLPVWAVGGEPRHPSRWQRFTYRSHPGVNFDTALELSLIRIESQF